MESIDIKQLLPQNELEKIFSRTQLWRLRESEQLSYFKIGRRIFYSPEHINDFLARCEKKSTNNKKQPRLSKKITRQKGNHYEK